MFFSPKNRLAIGTRWALVAHALRVVAHACLLPTVLLARPSRNQMGETEILLGGQAVIEGVMMRAPHSYCVAVRTPRRGIVQKREPLLRPQDRWAGWRLPVLRGLATLGQSLALGFKALGFSAHAVLEEESKGSTQKTELPGWLVALQIVISVAFFLFLHKYVPLVVASEFERRGWSGGWMGFNLIDGLVRIGVFLVFLSALSLGRDIRRVFEYHGAEHMVVYNWEAGREVSIENAQHFRPEHPRCGTSFLMVVLVVSLLLYTLLPMAGFGWRLLVRVLFLPVIAGASYEVIRAAGKHQGSAFWRVAVAPGLWLQRRITTRQPDRSQLAVAISALEGALELDRATGSRARAE